jgi:hypothetical protein
VVQTAAQAGTGAMFKATLEELLELDLNDCLHGYGKALLSCRGSVYGTTSKDISSIDRALLSPAYCSDGAR